MVRGKSFHLCIISLPSRNKPFVFLICRRAKVCRRQTRWEGEVRVVFPSRASSLITFYSCSPEKRKRKKTGSGWLLSTRDSQHRKLFTSEILLLRLKFFVHLLALSRIFFKSSNVRLGCCSGLPVFFSRSAKILGSSRGNGLNLCLTQPFFFRGGFRCLRFPWW